MPSVFDLMATLSLDSASYESGLDEAKKSGISKIGSGLATAAKIGGAAMAAAGAAAGAFAVSSVKAGSQFDSAMAQVAATMGVSIDEIQVLNEFAQEMGRTTAFSATEAAQALNYMALAGYDAETSMKMLPTVLDLAAAGGIDLASASDMVTDAQSALGLTLDETSEMVDKMARASSRSNTSVAQLGEAFLTIGGTAKTLSGGTTELSTALGILADNGIKGAEGGTALRNILLNLTPKSEDAAKAMEQIGLQAYDANGEMRPLVDIFADMNEGMKDMTTQERTNVLSNIFNKVDLKSINALLSTNVDRWGELTNAIDESNGAAQQMAETQLDNLAGDVTLFKSALEGAQIAISNRLTPTLRKFVQFGTNGISDITAALEEDGATGALEKFNEYLDTAVTGFSQKFPEILSTATSVFKGLVKSISRNLPSIMRGLSDAFVDVLKSFVEFAPDLIDSGAELFVSLVEGFTTAIPDIVEGIGKAIPKIAEALISHIPDILSAGVEMFASLGVAIVKAIPDIVAKIPELIKGIISGLFEGVGQIISDIDSIFDGSASTITAAEQRIIDKLSEERAALDETMAKRSEATESINSEFGYYQELWNELERIVDENGKVKEGYEDRARIITTVLSEATGQEITLVDGTIQKYDELKGSIESVILAEQAKALLAQDQEVYADAVAKVSSAYDTLVERQNLATDAELKLHEATEKQEYLNSLLNSSIADSIDADGSLAAELLNLSETVIPGLTEEYNTQKSALDDAQAQYSDYMAVISQHEGLMAAVAEGDVGAMSDAINNLTNDYREATYATRDELVAQHDNAVEHYENLKKAVKNGNKTVTDEMIQDAIHMVDKTEQELKAFDRDVPDIIEIAMEKGSKKIVDAKNTAVTRVSDYVGSLTDALDVLPDDFGAIGDNAASTLINRVTAYGGEAYNAGQSLATNLIKSMQNTLQIKSPSRIAKWLGEMFDKGLGVGIVENAPISEAESMVRDVVDAAHGSISDIGNVNIDGTNGYTGGGVVINMTINGAEGQDVKQLADLVSDRIMSQVERRKAVFA